MTPQDAAWIAFKCVAAVGIYAVASRGLFRATESLRWALLEIGERLINSESFPNCDKLDIRCRLDDVHSPLAAWKIVWSLFAIISRIISFRRPSPHDFESDIPVEHRKDFRRFLSLWLFSTVANSPAAFIVFGYLYVILAACAASVTLLAEAIAERQSHHAHRWPRFLHLPANGA